MYVIVGNKSYNLTDAEFHPAESGKPALLYGHDPHDRIRIVEGADAEAVWAAIVAASEVKVHPVVVAP